MNKDTYKIMSYIWVLCAVNAFATCAMGICTTLETNAIRTSIKSTQSQIQKIQETLDSIILKDTK